MFWSFAAAGAGHGAYVVLGLSSSPLGWLGFSAAFFGLPVLWAVVGLFLGRVNSKPYKLAFLVVAAVHYVSIVPLLSGEMFGDWDYFHRVLSVAPLGVLGGLVTYVAGQMAMWGAFFRAKRLG